MARLRSWTLLLAWVALTASCSDSADAPAPRAATALDLEGAPVDPIRRGATATVLVFTKTDCPISNRYAPEIRRIANEFSGKDVDFWLVYPDADETPDDVRNHIEEYDYPCPALRDVEHELVKRAGATITPEVAVFLGDGAMIYRGRIDDRVVDFGKIRAEPSVRDLERVLEGLVKGESISRYTTVAIGCDIPPR